MESTTSKVSKKREIFVVNVKIEIEFRKTKRVRNRTILVRTEIRYTFLKNIVYKDGSEKGKKNHFKESIKKRIDLFKNEKIINIEIEKIKSLGYEL